MNAGQSRASCHHKRGPSGSASVPQWPFNSAIVLPIRRNRTVVGNVDEWVRPESLPLLLIYALRAPRMCAVDIQGHGAGPGRSWTMDDQLRDFVRSSTSNLLKRRETFRFIRDTMRWCDQRTLACKGPRRHAEILLTSQTGGFAQI